MSLFAKKMKVVPEMLCVQIESGQKIWYEIDPSKPVKQAYDGNDDSRKTDSSVEEEGVDPQGVKPYISITKNDFRIRTKKALSNKEALSTLIRHSENTELLSVVNESKNGLIYGTQLSHLKDDNNNVVSIFSLYEVTDKVLTAAAHPFGEEALVIYQLAKDDGSDLLVFMNLSESGVLTYKAAIFEEDSAEAINTHMSASGFKANVKAYTVDQDGLFQTFQEYQLHAYPVDVALISMQNIDLITPYVTGAVMIGVVGIFAWGGINGLALSKAKTEFENKQVELSQSNEQIGLTLKANPSGYAKLTSVDVGAVFQESQMLYLATSRFTTSATPHLRQYSMAVSVKSGTSASSSTLNNEALLTESITRKIEEPCALDGIIFSGDLNEIKTNYTCKITHFNFGDIGL